MSHPILSPTEALFLWRLAATDGEAWKKDVKPDLKAADRRRLEEAGLVESAKRRAPDRRAASLHLTLTDRGWEWLSSHLDADLTPPRAPAGTIVLSLLLRGLKRHLDRSNDSLADILAPDPTNGAAPSQAVFPSSDSVPTPDLATRIADAYYGLSEGRSNVRVRLAALRSRLPDVPRVELDEALLHMVVSGEASLYRLDDPREIHDEDREAVFHTPSGEPRHIIYLGGSGS